MIYYLFMSSVVAFCFQNHWAPEVVMMDFDFVPAGGFPKRCDFIFAQVSDYCRQQGFNLHMVGLTKALLGRATAAEYPTATLGCIIISSGI